MSTEGRKNTALGIEALISALAGIRGSVQKALVDGHIDRKEAIDIFSKLAIACIHEGLQVALSVAQAKADQS